MYSSVPYLIMEDFQSSELAMTQRGAWSFWAQPVLCSAPRFCLHPHIRNDDRRRHASEKRFLLSNRSCHVNVNKRNHSAAIKKKIKLLHKCKQNKTKNRVKMMKKQCDVTQCKTYRESHILLPKCQKLITFTEGR